MSSQHSLRCLTAPTTLYRNHLKIIILNTLIKPTKKTFGKELAQLDFGGVNAWDEC